jgi:uncharacterized repeat protein (TIGR01451 family)
MNVGMRGTPAQSGRAGGGLGSRPWAKRLRGLVASVAVIAALAGGFAGTSAAYAAPGDPFPAADSLVFVAQQAPTQLYRATSDASGTVVFTPEGPQSAVTYNAVSYRTADNYLYGVVTTASTGFPVGALVRIGQGGVVTRVGTSVIASGQNVGAFGADGSLYTLSGNSTTMYVTNAGTGANVRTITLNASPTISDMTYANGYFWGITNSTTTAPRVVRINPSNGAVTSFAAPAGVTGDNYGAAWTFGNGNLGFSANTSGTVYQIAVTSPAATTPTFRVVASSAGPSSTGNDGAASPGLPTDLAISKTGPVALIPGGTVTYTLTVRNNGTGNSSGFVVNDTVPATLTNVASPDPACTVTGNAVRCVGGRLLAGATTTYTITASIPANIASGVTNTATVTANEEDPTPGNNTSTTAAVIARIGLVKHAGTAIDVNTNGLTDAGDTIAYTFDVTNTGQIALSAITVNDPKIGAVTCPQADLAVGATATCSAATPYTITTGDVTGGAVENTATATGTTPDGDDITSTPSTTSTPTTAPNPRIAIVKSASEPATSAAGESVAYSFLVTNTGNVTLTAVTVHEEDFSGTGQVPTLDCPPEAATLAPAAQVTCTASYVLTQADIDAGTLTNTATATGTPPGGTPPVSSPSEAVVDFASSPALTLAKTATPELITAAGQEVTYSFLITNTGNVTLADVAAGETAFSGTGTPPTVICPAGAASLAPVATVTCTATYSATQADINAGQITNTAVATGTSPTGAVVTSEPSSAEVTVFAIMLPLTGGTSADEVVILGGSAMLIALIIAIWHLRRLRRRVAALALSTHPGPTDPLNDSSH